MADGLPPMRREGLFLEDSEDVEVHALGTRTPVAETEVIRLVRVRGAFVHGCRAMAGTDAFIHVRGSASEDFALIASDISWVRFPLGVSGDVPRKDPPR